MLTILLSLFLGAPTAQAYEQEVLCGKLVASCHPSKVEFFTCALRVEADQPYVLNGEDPVIEDLQENINSFVLLHGESYQGEADAQIFNISKVDKVASCPN